MREVKILQELRHDNVVRLLEFFRVHRKLFLVFEYVEGTVLQVLLVYPLPIIAIAGSDLLGYTRPH